MDTKSTSLTVPEPQDLAVMDDVYRESMKNLEEMCGGRRRLIEGLVQSGDESAKALIVILGDQSNNDIPLYDLIKQTNRSPAALQEVFLKGAQVMATVETFNQIWEGLPRVIEKSIHEATTNPKAVREREMLLRLAGLLDKGGSAVIINQTFSGGGMAEIDSHISGGDLAHTNPFVKKEVIDIEAVESNG